MSDSSPPVIEDKSQGFANVDRLVDALQLMIHVKEYHDAPFDAYGDPQDEEFLTPDKLVEIINKHFNMSLMEFLSSTELTGECFHKFEGDLLKHYHYISLNALTDADRQAQAMYRFYQAMFLMK